MNSVDTANEPMNVHVSMLTSNRIEGTYAQWHKSSLSQLPAYSALFEVSPKYHNKTHLHCRTPGIVPNNCGMVIFSFVSSS
jgi:hypothetical protein